MRKFVHFLLTCKMHVFFYKNVVALLSQTSDSTRSLVLSLLNQSKIRVYAIRTYRVAYSETADMELGWHQQAA